MKFSEQWVREWANPDIATQALADQLSLAGLEVDGIEPAAGEFSGIVAGQVIALEQHLDADKLRICTVEAGEHNIDGKPLQIVCGAPNVVEGMFAPLATVGAVLPGGMKIKKGKLRGVESFGMLCGAAELGIADQVDGLWSLPETVPGTDVRELMHLDDQVIEVDLTPNRGDCLSVRGVAREIAVLNQCPLTELDIPQVAATSSASLPISIEAPEDCPHYVGRVLTGLDATATTPSWLVERLRRGGIRSLGPLVDVTNYVLLELGQPMHAFALNKLSGGIVVRRAKADESLELLNDETIKLDDDVLVIADGNGPVALAGIMGGSATACDDDTTDILLESAFFAPLVVAGKARRFGLSTDSSHRFERGVDPALQTLAIERATALLLDICGGEAGALLEQGSAQLERPVLTLRSARIERLLGVPFEAAQVEDILERLGMSLQATGGGWQVTPPSWRFDMEREEDLIEELARVRGYDSIPTATAPARMAPRGLSEAQLRLERMRNVLIERGYQEAVTYSFVDPKLQSMLMPGVKALDLANPISSELAQMRLSLWPGLIEALRYNVNRQQPRVQLFETGLRFVPKGEDAGDISQLQQCDGIAGLLWGTAMPEQWDSADSTRPADFYDIKADVEALLACGVQTGWQFVAAEHPALHPGQTAEVQLNGEVIGVVGRLHPKIGQQLGLKRLPLMFELDQAPVMAAQLPEFSPISRFQTNRRDLALVVDEGVSAAQLRAAIEKTAGEDLQEVVIFDVFVGENIEKGKKSIALGLILQSVSSTLGDEVMDVTMQKVVDSLRTELGAEIR